MSAHEKKKKHKVGEFNPRNYAEGPQAQIAGKAMNVPTDTIKPNPWNYNKQTADVFAKVVESMRLMGFVDPLIVRELPPGGSALYEIINGEHRWRAAIELGMPLVPVYNLGDVPDEKAKQLCIILNELGGKPDEIRLADLMRDISQSVAFDDLSKVMPFQDRELRHLIDSVNFSFANLSRQDSRAERVDIEDPELAAAGPSEADQENEVSSKRITFVFDKTAGEKVAARVLAVDSDGPKALLKLLDAWDLSIAARAASAAASLPMPQIDQPTVPETPAKKKRA